MKTSDQVTYSNEMNVFECFDEKKTTRQMIKIL